MASKPNLEQAIVDTSLSLAEDKDRESVRLHQAAEELNISLDEIRLHFREKEDITPHFTKQAQPGLSAVPVQ